MYFNVKGVIFYTSDIDNVDDVTGIATFALARQFIISNSEFVAGEALIPAFVRISQVLRFGIPAIGLDESVVF